MSVKNINLSLNEELPRTSSSNPFVPTNVKDFRARTLRTVGHAVFAFVGWPYENTDPRGGLTYALRTRKSGIITLDVASRRLTVDVLSARQARDIPSDSPRIHPRCLIHSAMPRGRRHSSRSWWDTKEFIAMRRRTTMIVLSCVYFEMKISITQEIYRRKIAIRDRANAKSRRLFRLASPELTPFQHVNPTWFSRFILVRRIYPKAAPLLRRGVKSIALEAIYPESLGTKRSEVRVRGRA